MVPKDCCPSWMSRLKGFIWVSMLLGQLTKFWNSGWKMDLRGLTGVPGCCWAGRGSSVWGCMWGGVPWAGAGVGVEAWLGCSAAGRLVVLAVALGGGVARSGAWGGAGQPSEGPKGPSAFRGRLAFGCCWGRRDRTHTSRDKTCLEGTSSCKMRLL